MHTMFAELPDDIKKVYNDHKNILMIKRAVSGDGIIYRIYLYGGIGQCWCYNNGWKSEAFKY